MKRNSTTIFIESPSGDSANPCITPVPWLNNTPDFTGITEPTLSVLKAAYELNKSNIIVTLNPLPVVVKLEPDWEGLTKRVLGGDLAPLYNRLTQASFVNPATATIQQLANANNIAVAAGKMDQSIAVTKVEGAVAASIQLLLSTSNYTFTVAEKTLWNNAITALNFSDLVKI